MLGDLVGKPGRDAAMSMLPTLQETYDPDFVVVNGENAAAGHGITPEIAGELLRSGVNVVTLGNHAWARREIVPYLEREPRIIRPMNYPEGTPGAGFGVYCARGGAKVAVANIMGRAFMEPLNDPFRAADEFLSSVAGRASVSLIDFHAEATSEKMALGYYLDGRVGAVVGTHTHVQTADERILPNGTAYITDVGMVGPQQSVIGMDAEGVVEKFVTLMPRRYQVAAGAVVLCGVCIDFNDNGRTAIHIERIQIRDIL
ncbi:MAG: TIGR00282 family metallophosphoesterase [Capsulimonadaceae bacterium]